MHEQHKLNHFSLQRPVRPLCVVRRLVVTLEGAPDWSGWRMKGFRNRKSGFSEQKQKPEGDLAEKAGPWPIDLKNSSTPAGVGDKIDIVVHYSDAAVNLHDRVWGVHGRQVEKGFRVEG
jgi:hypothetical protein